MEDVAPGLESSKPPGFDNKIDENIDRERELVG
jgi:hypothetical protein